LTKKKYVSDVMEIEILKKKKLNYV